MTKYTLILFQFLYINFMAQQSFRIIETNYALNDYEKIREDLQNFEFFSQDLNTHKTCTKHKQKNEYRIKADANTKFVLMFDDKDDALAFLKSSDKHDYGLLETDLQEEIEQITPENIREKSEKILARFNEKFRLNVSYDPSDEDIARIDDRAKKTSWDKENRFLLNFYMMEVTKRRFNFSEWKFEKINTFNPFYIPQFVGRNGNMNSYYSWLDPKKRKYFDFKLYLGI